MEEREEVTLSQSILNVISSETNRYFELEGATDDASVKERDKCVKNIVILADKYKFLYETDEKYYAVEKDIETKIKIAEMEQETKLKIAKLEAESKIKLADIDAQLKSEISKIDNETKLACCDADNQTKVSIANADIAQRQKEMYLDVINIGTTAALKAGSAVFAYNLVSKAFIAEFNNGILGKSTGTRLATNFISKLMLL